MPFMTAPQQQNAWAVGNNVNFLASNYHEPAYGNLGSGIYSPSGPLNYTYDASTASKMVITQVPKLVKQKVNIYLSKVYLINVYSIKS